jgi:hypothetical protein
MRDNRKSSRQILRSYPQTVHIIYVVPVDKRIENGRAFNPVVIGQIQIVSNLFDYSGLSQHVAVVLLVFQTMDIALALGNTHLLQIPFPTT